MVILSISNCSEDIVHLQAHFCVSVCVYAAFCVSIQGKYSFVLGFFYIVVAVIVVMSLLSVVLLSKIG